MSTLDRFRRLTGADKDQIRHEIIANCDLVGDCWVYRGTKNPATCYGMKYIQGQMRTVSRFMLAYSDREGLNTDDDACHVRECPYKACCNPRHLFWGTHSENCKQREADAKASRLSRLTEEPSLYPQPVLGHETHEQHAAWLADLRISDTARWNRIREAGVDMRPLYEGVDVQCLATQSAASVQYTDVHV
jgi:hypothetical protein